MRQNAERSGGRSGSGPVTSRRSTHRPQRQRGVAELTGGADCDVTSLPRPGSFRTFDVTRGSR